MEHHSTRCHYSVLACFSVSVRQGREEGEEVRKNRNILVPFSLFVSRLLRSYLETRHHLTCLFETAQHSHSPIPSLLRNTASQQPHNNKDKDHYLLAFILIFHLLVHNEDIYHRTTFGHLGSYISSCILRARRTRQAGLAPLGQGEGQNLS